MATFVFVDEVDDGGEDRGLDLSELVGGVLLADKLVEPPETAPKGGIKAILNVVIGASLHVERNILPLVAVNFVNLK